MKLRLLSSTEEPTDINIYNTKNKFIPYVGVVLIDHEKNITLTGYKYFDHISATDFINNLFKEMRKRGGTPLESKLLWSKGKNLENVVEILEALDQKDLRPNKMSSLFKDSIKKTNHA